MMTILASISGRRADLPVRRIWPRRLSVGDIAPRVQESGPGVGRGGWVVALDEGACPIREDEGRYAFTAAAARVKADVGRPAAMRRANDAIPTALNFPRLRGQSNFIVYLFRERMVTVVRRRSDRAHGWREG